MLTLHYLWLRDVFGAFFLQSLKIDAFLASGIPEMLFSSWQWSMHHIKLTWASPAINCVRQQPVQGIKISSKMSGSWDSSGFSHGRGGASSLPLV